MTLTNAEVEALSARLKLGSGHEAQERAVAVALCSLLVQQKKGVVLADEVGFGKTYEALAIMALLCERAWEARKSFDRVLVLCKSSLLEKWQEELSATRPGARFPAVSRSLAQSAPGEASFPSSARHRSPRLRG